MKRLSFAVCALLVFVAFVGVSQTYEQIMAEIAEYPGPEEPLYEPGSDEAIWLTDLEGHADIYDNDSIKINYADWFDKSQISRIVVKRNGISMQFLPDMLDVDFLTNEQMKSFDGNPAEHTPASEHSDHAIFGYEYAFWFHGGNPSIRIETATIRSPVHYSGEKAVNVGPMTDVIDWSESRLVEVFQKYPEMGFDTVQFGVAYFMHSVQDNDLFSLSIVDGTIHPWGRTLTESEIRKILRVIHAVGLKAEFRIEIWISEKTRYGEGETHRGALRPQNVEAWFENYGDICVSLAEILEDEGGEVFTPMCELSRTETYESLMNDLLGRIKEVFTGRLSVNQQTQTFLLGKSTYSEVSNWRTILDQSSFWDYPGIEIGMSCNPSGPWETQNDQRLSVLIEGLLRFWQPAVSYFRERYPEHPIRFSEAANFNFNGVGRGEDYFIQVWNPGNHAIVEFELDNQEDADIRTAYMIVGEFLDIDGIAIWSILPHNWEGGQQIGDAEGDIAINDLPSEKCVVELIGGVLE